MLIVTGKYKDTYNPHTYTITLSEASKTLKETETYTIIPTCTDNGQVVSNTTQVTFVSSDENIATVDSNGLVSCKLQGSCIITSTYRGVNAILNVTVEAKPSIPVVNYTSTWSNNNGTLLRLMSSTTVTVVKTIDSISDTSLVVNYARDSTFNSLLSQKKISITKISNTSYTIKNTNTTTVMNITITLTDANNGTVIETKVIQLKGV